jgi:hypothetical protein
MASIQRHAPEVSLSLFHHPLCPLFPLRPLFLLRYDMIMRRVVFLLSIKVFWLWYRASWLAYTDVFFTNLSPFLTSFHPLLPFPLLPLWHGFCLLLGSFWTPVVTLPFFSFPRSLRSPLPSHHFFVLGHFWCFWQCLVVHICVPTKFAIDHVQFWICCCNVRLRFRLQSVSKQTQFN